MPANAAAVAASPMMPGRSGDVRRHRADDRVRRHAWHRRDTAEEVEWGLEGAADDGAVLHDPPVAARQWLGDARLEDREEHVVLDGPIAEKVARGGEHDGWIGGVLDDDRHQVMMTRPVPWPPPVSRD